MHTALLFLSDRFPPTNGGLCISSENETVQKPLNPNVEEKLSNQFY